jgi:hypothetical protein
MNSPNVAVSFELRDWFEFLECGSERIPKPPNRPRSELLVLRFEVQIMHRTRQVFRCFALALDEGLILIDDYLGGNSVSSLPFQVSTFFRMDPKFRCIRSTPSAMQSTRENDFECFANTGVNTLGTMFSTVGFLRPGVVLSHKWNLWRPPSWGAILFRHVSKTIRKLGGIYVEMCI